MLAYDLIRTSSASWTRPETKAKYISRKAAKTRRKVPVPLFNQVLCGSLELGEFARQFLFFEKVLMLCQVRNEQWPRNGWCL